MAMKALFRFDVEFDIGESYLYGVAIGEAGRFAINLQGGSTMVVVPRNLLAELLHVNKASLHIRTDSETITTDARLSLGNEMIQIYDDFLLQRLVNTELVALEIEVT